MRNNRKFLLGLFILGVLLSACTQAHEQRAKDATVLIIAGNADGSVGNGSGFFVQRDKIVTNIHVVAGAKIIFAVGRKKVYNIEKVAGYDPERDLVILKVSGKGNPLEPGEGQIGDAVSAVGYPDGSYKDTKSRVQDIRSDKQLKLDSVLAAGNSGGPILNGKGQVIGVTVSSDEDFSYASASSILNTLLDSLDEEDLSDWQKRDPIFARVCKTWGYEKLKSENYDLAIKYFDKSIELYQYDHAYEGRGYAKENLGRYQEAIQDYTQAIRLNPEDAGIHYNRGNAKRKSKDYEGAIQDYTEATKLNSKFAVAYLNRGIAKAAKRDYKGAIQDYEKVIELKPKDADLAGAYYNLGSAKRKSKDYEGAIQAYNTILDELNQDFANTYLYRGVSKAEKSAPDYAGAIDDYTQAIELKKCFAAAYYNRGNAEKVLGQDGNAKIDYAKAHYCWGIEASNSRNFQEAIKEFDKSIALNPDYEAYYAQGNAKEKISDYEGAIQNYTNAMAREPDYAEPYYRRGTVRFLRGNKADYQAAIDDFEVASKLEPNYAEAYYMVGLTRHRLGENEVVIDRFDKALELNPRYAEAYKARGDAKADLEEDADGKEDFVLAYYYWGDEAHKKAQYQEAIKNFNTSLAFAMGPVVTLTPVVDKKYAYIYDARGNAKTGFGKSKAGLGDLDGARKLYREAIEDHDKAIRLDPESAMPDYYNNRGTTKYFRGIISNNNAAIEDYQSAIGDFRKAIEEKFPEYISLKIEPTEVVEPRLTNAYYLRGKVQFLLGYAKANQGNTKEARKLYKSAIDDFIEAMNRDPKKESDYNLDLGIANAALGKAKAAIMAFEKAKYLKAASEKRAN